MSVQRVAAAIVSLVVASGCAVVASRADSGSGSGEDPARPLVLLVAGESLGNLEPCNCVQGMLGGFPRRLSALTRERARADVVTLDGGDLTASRDLHPRLLEAKTRAALELLAHGGVAAVAVGEKDLRLGHAPLRRAADEVGVRLLGANLSAGDLRPFAASQRVVVAGRVVVVVGVLDPELGDPSGQLEVGDPDAAAREAFAGADASAPGGALRVLLFHGSLERARETLRVDLPVDVVFCGHERDAARPPERHGRAWLVETLRDARALARVELLAGGVDPKVDRVLMDGQVPDDAWARDRVNRYYQAVSGLPEPPRKPTPEGGDFRGTEECAGCHVEAAEKFSETRHHGSYAHVLEKDPKRAGLFECIGCHVTGQGFEAGFRSVEETPHLAEVSCESCHGVGGNHVDAAPEKKKGYGVLGLANWRPVCISCHDASNSPNFDFERGMERIKHWSPR